MEKLYELKEMLCDELKEYGDKGKLDVGALEIVDKLAHAVKNIDRIIHDYEEEGYSGNSAWYPYMGRSYRGGSYARRGGKRDSMGRYSRAEDEMQGVIDDLRGMVKDLPQDKQYEVHDFIRKMEM